MSTAPISQEIARKRARAQQTKAKVIEILAVTTEPMEINDLHTAVPSGLSKKHFAQLLHRMMLIGLIKRVREPSGRRGGTYVKGDIELAPSPHAAARTHRRKLINSHVDRNARSSLLRAKVIATLTQAPGPMMAKQLQLLPEAEGYTNSSFITFIDRMRKDGFIRSVLTETGGHNGYTSIEKKSTKPSSLVANGSRDAKRPYHKREAPIEDMGLEINQRDASLAFNLGGGRVTVKWNR